MNARNVLGALLLCAAAFCVPLSAADAPLKIGVVGTGDIGGALATHWAKAGHELVISSRHPEELQELAKSLGPKVRVGTPSEAAKFGDVILLSVPYKATPELGRDLANDWKGKILLDTGNPYPFRDGAMATDARKRGTGVTSKEFLPGVRLVRAFNAINESNLKNDGNRKGGLWAIPLASDDAEALKASDDAEALKVAQRLVRDAGFDPVVVGGLARAREFDVGSKVYTRLLTAPQLREELGLK
jgi:8-hydroxy-5-deazaflavin:NADPH oxidoreductase